MPPHVQTALVNTAITEPHALAEEADRFFLATHRFVPDVMAPTPSYTPPGAAALPVRGPIVTDDLASPGLCYFHARFGVPLPMQFQRDGKRQGLRSVVAVSAAAKGRLLFVVDTLSGRRFLCDTGAQRSVLPATVDDAAGGLHGPMVTFYHRFAHVMRPLYEALKGTTPNQDVVWPAEADRAFEDTKVALCQAAMLVHPSPGAPVALSTDASDYAVGAVFEQWVEGAWQPLAFFSRQLVPKRAARCLVGNPPLPPTSWRAPWSASQQRQLAFISEYTTDIRHIAGKSNVVADCLSRAVVGAVQLGLDYAPMGADQAADRTLQSLKDSDTGLQLGKVAVGASGVRLWCDLSTGQPTPLVPASWQRSVFETIHSLSHPGRKASRSKVHRHTKAPLEPFVVLERRFDHVNVDLVGPLPPSRDFTYLLTMVDRTTRWPEAVPLASIMSADVARTFIGTWVSRFGTPSDPSSDRGAQFTSEIWNAVAGGLGVKLHRTTAYHTQANGLCERFHRSFLQHGDKSLVVDIGGRPETISVDRIKPAQVDISRPLVLAQAPRPTPRTPPSTLSPWSVGSSFDRDGASCVPRFPPLSPCHLYSESSGHHSIPEWGF
uniref:Integrase catalytic domain-containing protein n=1 Tax=Knipowitschia caucasica TaxID=637954 RepID=A0AAV2L6A5_KNICA